MHAATRRCLLLTLLLMAAASLGCGQRRYPVSGKVTYDDGAPYTAGGFVALEKGEGKDRILVRAPIGEDGTFRTGDGAAGALAGEYQVRLIPPPPEPPVDEPNLDVAFGKGVNKPVPPPVIPFDKKFLDFGTSGIAWTAESGAQPLLINIGNVKPR